MLSSIQVADEILLIQDIINWGLLSSQLICPGIFIHPHSGKAKLLIHMLCSCIVQIHKQDNPVTALLMKEGGYQHTQQNFSDSLVLPGPFGNPACAITLPSFHHCASCPASCTTASRMVEFWYLSSIFVLQAVYTLITCAGISAYRFHSVSSIVYRFFHKGYFFKKIFTELHLSTFPEGSSSLRIPAAASLRRLADSVCRL